MTGTGDSSPTALEFEIEYQKKVDDGSGHNNESVDNRVETFPKLLLFEKLHITIPPPAKLRGYKYKDLQSPSALFSPASRFPPAKGVRAKSSTEAELRALISSKEEIGEILGDLLASPLPLDLTQARAHRASIKQERKDHIAFIRSRTNSRASAIAHSRKTSLDMKETEKPRSAFSELTKKLESCDSLFEDDEEELACENHVEA